MKIFGRRMPVFCWLLLVLFSACGAEEQAPTPYTVLIYMNGSDLESNIGAATGDLAEMLTSGLRSENANVLVMTGGALTWHNSVVPDDACVVWSVRDGALYELQRMPLRNMSDPDTLAAFIRYGLTEFPARQYGLILWDHGGGAVAGFGYDEHFNRYGTGSMTLPQLAYAFDKGGLGHEKTTLAFLGFDACLMATAETAALAAPFAHYLIASVDLEPGEGWDYHFLALFNRRPDACGRVVGIHVVDTFMDFFGPESDEILTLSVVDLGRIAPVTKAWSALMTRADDRLQAGAFPALAQKRRDTKTFGYGSPRDNYNDMVDIGDTARRMAALFPEEAADVFAALDGAVLYHRHNSPYDLAGLSMYYIYGGRSEDAESLTLYAQVADADYVRYLHRFFAALSEGPAYVPRYGYGTYNGQRRKWYYVGENTTYTHYAVPDTVDGCECDVIVAVRRADGESRVLGYRRTGGRVKPKGYCAMYANRNNMYTANTHTILSKVPIK